MDKIRQYINGAFEGIPQTQKILELKEELISNLTERYQDELSKGFDENTAYHNAIAGIGDLSELVDSLREPLPLSPLTQQERRRRALRIAVSAGLFIISPFLFFTFTIEAHLFGIGILSMFLCIAVACSLLIFDHMSRPDYKRADETLVEDFKEFRMKSLKHKRALYSIIGAYWSIILTLYLSISFLLDNWSVSWILFLIAMAGYLLLIRVLKKEPLSYCLYGAYWFIVLSVYFIVSFTFMNWASSWLLFPMGAAGQGILYSVQQLRRNSNE